MAELVTLTQIKEHLRTEHDDHDTLLGLYNNAASDYVILYLKEQAATHLQFDAGGVFIPLSPVPPAIQVATLLWISHLYDRHAAEVDGAPLPLGEPPRSVASLLHQFRDPELK